MKPGDIAFYVFATVFAGGSIIGMIWAGVVGTRDDDHCDRECQPFNRVDRFRSDGKLFTVCRDIDGGFQIREVR